MNVLVINAGSSSMKYQLISVDTDEVIIKGHIDGIGLENCSIKVNDHEEERLVKDHHEAVAIIISSLQNIHIDAIGHRVVHGGPEYAQATLLDEHSIQKIEEFSNLAPLHNPINLLGIKACKEHLPEVPQVAVFDTAFHQTMDESSYRYALPEDWYHQHKIRKYGFHGTSHKYLAQKIKLIFQKEDLKIITCHLGNGASITAIDGEKVIDTSMGFTPLPGLIMGTRCGDMDPEIISYLHEKGMPVKDIFKSLNKQSGLLGITGKSDMREVYESSKTGDEKSQLMIEMYAKRLTFYIGGYISLLQGADVIIFSGGTGQGAFYIREKVLKNLSHLGVYLHEDNNNCPWIDEPAKITSEDSKIEAWVIPTNEEYMIAKETQMMLQGD